MKKFLLQSVLFALTIILLHAVAAAATFTVTNTNDSGTGSLRQAVADANFNGQADTIVFDPTVFATAQTIVLTSGQIVIVPDWADGVPTRLSINGPGASRLTIDGNFNSRIFDIANMAEAAIDGLTLTRGNGLSSGEPNSAGGAIRVGTGAFFGQVNLILTNCVVTGNRATSAIGVGGGILIHGWATISNSAIVNNESNNAAGGIYARGSLRITNSTISHNVGNGVVFSSNGTFYLTNSTVAFNRVPGGSAAGIWLSGGQFVNPRFEPRNSIIAKNGSSQAFGSDVFGFADSQGYNIIGNVPSILPNVEGDQIGVDPQLDPVLRDNGFGIPTHALRANSTAIDRGTNCVLTPTPGGCLDPAISTDQRGIARPQDGDGNGVATVDIGAFEATRNEVAAAPAMPDLQAASDSGASSTDNITLNSNISFDISGVESGATVELMREGVIVSSGVAAGPTITLTDAGLSDNGVFAYTVRQKTAAVTSLQSAPLTVTFDTVGPTVTLNQAADQADPVRTLPIRYTAVFNENVVSPSGAAVSLEGSTAGIANATVDVTGSGTTYTVSVGNLNADGNVLAKILQGTVLDLAGNSNVASTSTDNTVRYDTTAPEVTINQASSQADPTRFTSINFTVVFNEAVTGFTGADVSLAGSTVNVTNATKTVTGSGTTYNVAIGGIISPGGTVVASIPALSAQDAAGNVNNSSTSTDNSVFLDNVAPTATVNQAAGQSDPTNGLPINYTVVFSEPVTGLDRFDLSFTGSTMGVNLNAVEVSGSGNTYNLAVSGLLSNGGTLRVAVRSNSVTDAVGNTNSASTSTDNAVTLDNVAPSVTVSQAPNQLDPTSVQPVRFRAVFSEPVTGFGSDDISFEGSTIDVNGLQVSVSGSGTSYDVEIGNITTLGELRIGVVAAAATDALQNPNAASSGGDNIVTLIAPFATISGQVTNAEGRGLNKVQIVITLPDGSVRYGRTNSFGYYSFRNVPTGNVTLSFTRKPLRETTRTIFLTTDLLNYGVEFD